MIWDNAHDMRLGEKKFEHSLETTTEESITRVPGGWIYTCNVYGHYKHVSTTYIPYSDEFNQKKNVCSERLKHLNDVLDKNKSTDLI